MQDKKIPETAEQMKLMSDFPSRPDNRVTLSNWTEGPAVRWGFLHATELVPSARVYRGKSAPLRFRYELADLDDLTFTNRDDEELTIRSMLDQTYTDGFLVLHHGRIITEQYFNGMRPESEHLLQSVTKSVVGILAGILIDERLLNPDKLVTDYIPELGLSGYADATVRQVIDMTASILYREDYGVVSQLTMHEATAGWRPRTGELNNLPESQFIFLQSLQKDPHYKHRERFNYISCNTDVLGWMMERATDTKLSDLLSQKIWSKLGAEENARMLIDPWGSSAASGGLNVTLRDLGRFGQMVLQGGHFNGNQIIPNRWIEDIRTKGDQDAWKKGDGSGIGYLFPEGSYRMQWWNTGQENEAFYAAGIHGQYVYIVPSADVVIVKLSSQPAAIDGKMIENTMAAFDTIADELQNNDQYRLGFSLRNKISEFKQQRAAKSGS